MQQIFLFLNLPLLLYSLLSWGLVSFSILLGELWLTRFVAPEQISQPPPTLDEIDVIRHREITSKAVSAILLLVLKWFKVSRTSSQVIHSFAFHERRRCRCDEVPSSWWPSPRYKLFAAYSQDVRVTGSFPDRVIQG